MNLPKIHSHHKEDSRRCFGRFHIWEVLDVHRRGPHNLFPNRLNTIEKS